MQITRSFISQRLEALETSAAAIVSVGHALLRQEPANVRDIIRLAGSMLSEIGNLQDALKQRQEDAAHAARSPSYPPSAQAAGTPVQARKGSDEVPGGVGEDVEVTGQSEQCGTSRGAGEVAFAHDPAPPADRVILQQGRVQSGGPGRGGPSPYAGDLLDSVAPPSPPYLEKYAEDVQAMLDHYAVSGAATGSLQQLFKVPAHVPKLALRHHRELRDPRVLKGDALRAASNLAPAASRTTTKRKRKAQAAA